jgi:predicted dehydrogenase
MCSAVVIFSAASSIRGEEPLRVGIIGLDTSHAIAFTDLLNKADNPPELAGCKVVAVYPKGSPDIESSTSRVPDYTKQMQAKGVEIVDSIDALLAKVDCVLLETNDGRPHLEQLVPCLKAKKRTFIDKPIAGSLADAVAIFDVSKHYGVPVWSSSALRFGKNTQAARAGELGEISHCEASSPASLEKTHPDLFWYGIHGCEALFTVMGPKCESVTRTSEEGLIVVTGTWEGGRTGVFREGKGYSGHAKGDKGEGPIGAYDGYQPLVIEIVKYFRTGEVPVTPEETLALYAFMEAADESKRQSGHEVPLADVLESARNRAAARVKEITRE